MTEYTKGFTKYFGLLSMAFLIACAPTPKIEKSDELVFEEVPMLACENLTLDIKNCEELLERPDIASNNFEFDSLTHYWDHDTLILSHYYFSLGSCLYPKFSFIEDEDSIFIDFVDESSCDLATICSIHTKVLFSDSAQLKAVIYRGNDIGLVEYEKNIESTSQINPDDYIDVEYDAETDYANYLVGEWADVPNPFIAVYKGNSFGDYHHIEFEGENGEYYDFGDGNNSYGDCELFFDDDQFTDNPKYLNKTMVVYWEWKTSTFPCCEGDYTLTTAKIPSIVNLELKK